MIENLPLGLSGAHVSLMWCICGKHLMSWVSILLSISFFITIIFLNIRLECKLKHSWSLMRRLPFFSTFISSVSRFILEVGCFPTSLTWYFLHCNYLSEIHLRSFILSTLVGVNCCNLVRLSKIRTCVLFSQAAAFSIWSCFIFTRLFYSRLNKKDDTGLIEAYIYFVNETTNPQKLPSFTVLQQADSLGNQKFSKYVALREDKICA